MSSSKLDKYLIKIICSETLTEFRILIEVNFTIKD